MPEVKFIAFIGSTREDLTDYRAAVRAAVEGLGLAAEGMETWAVEDTTAVDLCRRKVSKSDLYIGIYAYRYGWQPPGFDDKSITELEYDWAGEKGIPRLCFVIDDNHPWPETKKDYKTKAELDAFKARVRERLVGFFTTPENLKSQVAIALPPVIEQIRRARPTFTCNHVPRPEVFAGRADDLAALAAALDGDRAVAITAVKGIGGIGKTTLARQFAHHYDAHFGLKLTNRTALGRDYRENAVPTILREWAGQDFPPDMPLEAQIAETRRILTRAAREECGEPVLVIIDDVWPNTVTSARQLCDAAPDGARLLITTRSEDVAARLNAHSQTLQYMPPADGAALLLEHLRDQPHAADCLPALADLSRALGGHPLALTLAARQLRRNFNPRRLETFTAQLQQGIEAGDDFRDLKLDAGDDKVDSVSATLRQTLDALGGGDAALNALRLRQFRALGALPPELPVRLEHLRALWGDETDDEYLLLAETDADDALADFVAEGLLTPDPDRPDWYSQHRLLRAYARALLRQSGDFDAVTARHRAYLIARADSVFVERQNQPETWDEIAPDLPQLHALGDELAARLAGTTDPGTIDELFEAALTPPPGPLPEFREGETLTPNPPLPHNHGEQPGRAAPPPNSGEDGRGFPSAAPALLAACENFAAAVSGYIFRRYVGAEGRRWLWAGLAAARARDSRDRVRLFAGALGSWHNQRGFKPAALVYHEQALQACLALDDKWNQAVTLNNIGLVWHDLGEKPKALEYYEQALPRFRAVGDRRGEAATLSNIGKVWDDLGEKRRALDYYEQALPLFRAVGDRGGEATTLNNIGGVYRQLGDNQKALDYYEQALPLFRAVGNRRGEAVTLNNIAMIYYAWGDYEKELAYYAQSLPLRIAVQDPSGEAVTRFNMAETLWRLGQRDEALAHMQTARDLKARIGISTETEDQYLMLWQVMQQTGIYEMDELMAFTERWQQEQQSGSDTDEA